MASSENSVSVALDDYCASCEVSLSADVTFGFGIDLFVGDYSGGGPINQFFDITIQSLLDSGDFDNDASTAFPPAGDVLLSTDTVNGDYDVLGLTDATSLAAFTGNGNIFFDVGPALSLFLSLACRDASGGEIGCTEEVDISAGGADWAMQVVYTYNPELGLGTPTDPGRVYDGVGGLQILPRDGVESDLDFFAQNRGFTPEVIPVPLPAVLLLSGLGAVVALRRKRSGPEKI